METEEIRLQSERLPTLYEVLNNQTATPVDSWSFYTFLYQYPGALNYMDFWIDVMAHLRLCKQYVKGIRESMFLEVEEHQKNLDSINDTKEFFDNMDSCSNSSSNTSKRSRAGNRNTSTSRQSATSMLLLEALLNEGYLDYHDNIRVSQFLKSETGSESISQVMESLFATSNQEQRMLGQIQGTTDNKRLSVILDDYLVKHMDDTQKPKITSKQLIASSNAIVDRYLVLDDSLTLGRPLFNIPEHMRMEAISLVKDEQRYDPDVFEPLKILAFQFLEIYCFPKFLSSVALHNLQDSITLSSSFSGSPYSQCTTLSRVATGFVFWGIGFWIGYILIFLNYSRNIRVVTLAPFFLGSYYIICGIYHLDIIYTLFGVTQTLVPPPKLEEPELGYEKPKPTRSAEIPFFLAMLGARNRLAKVRHPFVLSIMRKRAWWCLFLVLFFTAILTAIFSGVPSTRL
ncbi:HDL504Cp [Eremothecium sinecaudum]|uniref:HDL504Cp n=1 Tax=Eremothecium sinecaudum TaxID=45286 RepID=A0A0X8HRR4_9SACH|nr:HDL504Cp [Eremothecium sinecaudum]AMD20240.1 HDL504Cp [Eremothecium sinecaudum]